MSTYTEIKEGPKKGKFAVNTPRGYKVLYVETKNDAKLAIQLLQRLGLTGQPAPPAELAHCIELLDRANCPDCDGSGNIKETIRTTDGSKGEVVVVDYCRWCYERESLVDQFKGVDGLWKDPDDEATEVTGKW